MTVGLAPSANEMPSNLPMPAAKRNFDKRFSVPRPTCERRFTIRPYESFRDRKDSEKPQITFGFAALSTEGQQLQEYVESGSSDNYVVQEGRASPAPSVFSIYGEIPGPSTICEQPVGAQADVYISSLGERNRHLLKKFLDTSSRQENQYFVWIKDQKSNKVTVISLKTLENHLNATHRIRRVKWRHRSTDRVSVYRYSLPSITYEKSKHLCDCVMRWRKLWLLITWISFILFLCLIVVLGSLNPDDRNHPYLQYNATSTQITLQTLRNITIG